jgi:hypothetical protein
MSPADLARRLELIRCRVAVVTMAVEAEQTAIGQDAAKVLREDVDNALCHLVSELQPETA